MSVGKSDWRAERARRMRAVARVNASPDRDRIHSLLAGGNACPACGAHAVRYSVRDSVRRCGECGATIEPPAA